MTTPDLSDAIWHKSSRSGGSSGQCIEVAKADGVVVIRDSKNPAGPRLHLRNEDWLALLSRISGESFNPPGL